MHTAEVAELPRLIKEASLRVILKLPAVSLVHISVNPFLNDQGFSYQLQQVPGLSPLLLITFYHAGRTQRKILH